MRLLTLTDARWLMGLNRPWTFALNCTHQGANKFWLATGRGRNEPVEIHFGSIGSPGRILVKDWTYLERKVPEKLAKHYFYVSTPFVRVSDRVITAFIQGGLAAAQAVANTTKAQVPAQAAGPTKSVKVRSPSPTGDPWRLSAQISTVSPQGAGVWHGLDAQGQKICSLTRQGARDLVVRHPHITVGGLN